MNFQLIKISTSRIGSQSTIEIHNGKPVYISSLARTIMDAVYEWSRFNSLPTAYKWLNDYIDDKKIIDELIQITLRYANIATKRRIDYTLEKLTPKNKSIPLIQQQFKSAQGWITLDPTQKAIGKTNKKWRIIDNVNFLICSTYRAK